MSRKVNLFITQGEDFSYPITLTDPQGEPFSNSSVATASGAIRKSFISNTAVVLGVSVNTGLMTVSLPATSSANMVPGRYIYDIKFVSTTNAISKPVSGIVTITASATD